MGKLKFLSSPCQDEPRVALHLFNRSRIRSLAPNQDANFTKVTCENGDNGTFSYRPGRLDSLTPLFDALRAHPRSSHRLPHPTICPRWLLSPPTRPRMWRRPTSATTFEDLDDKREVSYIDMPLTPKATSVNPADAKLASLSRFAVQSVHLRECFAEYLGTFVMIVFGMGVNNQVTNSEEKNGTWLSINMCWGIGVLIGVYCTEGISGAHLNTAVTLAHCVYGRLPWWKAPGYMISQVLGAFVGAFVIWVMQWQNLNAIDPNRETTQSSFSTYPSDNISNYTAFYTEVVGTAMLLLGIYAITDQRNRPAGPVGAPFAFCLLIMALGMCIGMNTGYAINPARDFGPRLFTSIAGWGSKVFTLRDHYFWIPIVGPLVGGVIGAGLYVALVEIHHPRQTLP